MSVSKNDWRAILSRFVFRKWTVLVVVLGVHAVWVELVGRTVLAVLAVGEPGYLVWWAAIIIDAPFYLPISFVIAQLDHFGLQGHAVSFTLIKYKLLFSGSLQWTLVVLGGAYLWRRKRNRRGTDPADS